MLRIRHLLVCVAVLIPTLTRADPIGFVTLGDSLTASYAGKEYAGANSSWTDLLAVNRPGALKLFNEAMRDATSTDVLTGGQFTNAVSTVQASGATYVTVTVGANDVLNFLKQLNADDPNTFDPSGTVGLLITNLNSVVMPLQNAGAKVILANVPDITDTPAMKAALAGKPEVVALLQGVTDVINGHIRDLAIEKNIPVVDLDHLNALGNGPHLINGMDVSSYLYSVDGFHPSSLGSALLANAQLDALASYGDVDVPRFTNDELLGLAGLGEVYTTVGPGALAETPEPASLVLMGVGAVGLVVARRRRR